MDLKRKEHDNGIAVYEMTGSIYMGDDCRRMEAEIDRLISEHQVRVIFDFSGVDYLDSSGVGALVKCFSKLKKSGGQLRLAGVKGMVEGVLKLTRVNTVIGTFPDAVAAAKDFPTAGQN